MKNNYPVRQRVICIGLGPIGVETCRLVQRDPRLKLVGLVDKDPRKLAAARQLGLRLFNDIQTCVGRCKPEIAFLTTASRFPAILKDVKTLVRSGVHVVSSCEELSYPWLLHGKAAGDLHRFICRNKAKVVGTGVNPGFVMDALALTLAGVCQKVDSIRAMRVVDVSRRRLQLQRKMAVGLTRKEFELGLKAGTLGHAGLKESAALIGAGMGWKLKIQETIRPKVAGGKVIGITQSATGAYKGRKKVVLELSMSWKAKDPRDEIHITGTPPVHAIIRPGIQGDLATPACLVQAALKLKRAPVGLLTVKDLPVGV